MSDTKEKTTDVAREKMPRRARGSAHGLSILATGEPFIWLTGGALVLCLAMIAFLLTNVFHLGCATFIPRDLVAIQLRNGEQLLGEVVTDEITPLTADALISDNPENANPFIEQLAAEVGRLDKLPKIIAERVGPLKTERVNAEKRLETVRKQLAKVTASLSGKLDSVAARRKYAAKGVASQRLLDMKTLAESLEGRIVGIDGEIDVAAKSADYFASLATLDVKAITDAPHEFKKPGLRALIDLVAAMRGTDELLHRSRKLRTENYELTNTHYRWVADYQISNDGEHLPPNAVILERTENGRFYGYPVEFVEIIPLTQTDQTQRLKAAVDFLSTNQFRLSPEQQQSLAGPLATMVDELQDASSSEIRKAIATNQSEGVDRIDLASKNIATGEYHILPCDDNSDMAEVAGIAKTWTDPDAIWQQFEKHHTHIQAKRQERNSLQKHELGHEYARQENARLRVRQAELDYDIEAVAHVDALKSIHLAETMRERAITDANVAIEYLRDRYHAAGNSADLVALATAMRDSLKAELDESIRANLELKAEIESAFNDLPPPVQKIVERAASTNRDADEKSAVYKQHLDTLTTELNQFQLVMQTSDERIAAIPLGMIVRGFQANTLTAGEKRATYVSRWWEFLTDEPREANSEGGVLPAIWGTISMTIIMSLAVVPFGVLAALYLREYAKSGPIVSAVRVAINNLAGVPSIVFGVFGLGFFCYRIGAYIDGGPVNAGFEPMPTAKWFLWLAGLAVLSVAAFISGVVNLSGPAGPKSVARRAAGAASIVLWIASLVAFIFILTGSPYFNGFYEANLPNPYWGKGGVLWASLTLALMTLPVVIVATEETLAAVPNSMREGSYGCGASKWQTIRRVVLPQALPGIMTGMILAMARGAGEVAPLMLVGAVKLAPELPVDGVFPFVHANRSFMHLGFHIFDLGFQSQNSEAAKPVVYTTTLLLIVIITILNLVAVWLRSYLRKRFTVGQF